MTLRLQVGQTQLTLPPAFRILSLAFSVTRSAHTVILGTSKILQGDC